VTTPQPAPLYTIGYGARSIDAFIAALRMHGIAYLIDVRSRPYSRFKPEFSREALAAALQAAGIRYVYMGDTLGGMPKDATVYDSDGKVLYEKLENSESYLSGISRLEKALEMGLAVAIMCSEGKPEMCHRSKLIGRTLTGRGLAVSHIDADGGLATQAQVISRLTSGQPSLFGDGFLEFTSRKRYDMAESEDESDEE